MNFIALWVRLIWLIVLCVLGVVLAFALLKSYRKTIKIAVSSIIILGFMVGCVQVVKSIVNPDIKTFKGTYIGFLNPATSIGPFEVENCFETNGNKIYVNADFISQRVLSSEPLEEGVVYEIYYEAGQNLIISIEKIR